MVGLLTKKMYCGSTFKPCLLSGQVLLDAAFRHECLFGVCALFEHESQRPQSGIGARQNEEDQDQHDTSSRWGLL